MKVSKVKRGGGDDHLQTHRFNQVQPSTEQQWLACITVPPLPRRLVRVPPKGAEPIGCIYTLVPVSVNYSLTKASVGGRTSEANLRDYRASVFTNFEHRSS